ncbi:PadR family transcriptional regulator [Actinomycetospora lutea]|uniref:PadR family transcriptional regulator n=1 Tax=Actinomycetospora lutea TaxID=663604 RepID=UPI00236631B0|nr:PadR family transcriptional regulator [Actinomycetospora lutea]MDD7940990.1 PadR family transcriptional regulator [Actinomycetospora lutea]
MTAEPSFAADHSDRDDLSSAFGRPATSSLRGILPPRARRGTEQVAEEEVAGEADDAVEEARDEGPAEIPAEAPAEDPASSATDAPETPETAETAETAEPADAPGPGPAPRTRRRDAGGSRATPATGVANRRWGSVRMASREHVELVVLASLRRGPADGRELAARLRDDSAGGLAPPPTTVQRTLHHLARHGLVERVDTDRRRYRLTILGTRIARARVRAWRAMRRAVDAVVVASDDTPGDA